MGDESDEGSLEGMLGSFGDLDKAAEEEDSTKDQDSLFEMLLKQYHTTDERAVKARDKDFFGVYYKESFNFERGEFVVVKTLELCLDDILPKGTYHFQEGCWLEVPNEFNLIIRPGTVFKFSHNSGILVKDGSRIYAAGTEQEPIKFVPAIKGATANILVLNSKGSKFEFCEISGLCGRKISYEKEEYLSEEADVGALALIYSDTIVENCRFIDNSGFNGAAVHISHGSAHFLDTDFTNNTARSKGGAVYVESGGDDTRGGFVEFSGCNLRKNRSTQGGGIFNVAGEVLFQGGEISGNTAEDYGGGVRGTIVGKFRFSGSKLESNVTNLNGGGINIDIESSVHCEDTQILGNVAERGDGGGAYLTGKGYFSGCEISENEALDVGGGLCCFFDRARLEDTKLRDNNAGKKGGAVFVGPNGEVILGRGCAVSGNTMPQLCAYKKGSKKGRIQYPQSVLESPNDYSFLQKLLRGFR